MRILFYIFTLISLSSCGQVKNSPGTTGIISKKDSVQKTTQPISDNHYPVFENASPKAKELLQAWRSLGLPQPDGEPSHQLWQHNPYIRENGYGEIRINDVIHTDFMANGKEWS